MIETYKKVTFEGESFKVELPTIRQEIQIESKKAEFSEGNYFEILKNQTVKSFELIEKINALSVLEVLIPQLNNWKGTESLMELGRDDSDKLVNFYLDSVAPFLEQIEEEIEEATSEEGEDSEKK